MRLLWRQRRDRAAIDQDLPAVGPERARQQVDQRALARSIFAEQSVNAARDELDPSRVFSNEYAERVLGL